MRLNHQNNLFVIGSIRSGKSAVVNIFGTVLRDNNQIATTAVAYGHHTESLTRNVSLNSYINEMTLRRENEIHVKQRLTVL